MGKELGVFLMMIAVLVVFGILIAILPFILPFIVILGPVITGIYWGRVFR